MRVPVIVAERHSRSQGALRIDGESYQIDRQTLELLVERETAVVWAARRLLDAADDPDDVARDSGSTSDGHPAVSEA